jgi:hypothetical protein
MIFLPSPLKISLLLFILLFTELPTTRATSVTNDVSIEASPTSISTLPGFTKDLALKCSHNHKANSDFGTVLSLIVSKRISESTAVSDAVYRELATVSSFDRYNVNVKNASLEAKVTGQLIANGESFISLKWTYPSTNVSGTYTCDAHGMDLTGHPKVSSVSIEITEAAIDLNMIAERLKQMDIHQEHLVTSLEKTKADFDAYKLNTTAVLGKCKADQENWSFFKTKVTAQLDENARDLTSLVGRLDTCESYKECWRNDSLYTSLLEASNISCSLVPLKYPDFHKVFKACTSYNRHLYFLSQDNGTHFYGQVASSHCEHHGGYLAELSDQQEWDVVVNLLEENKVTDLVLLGAQRQDNSSNWTFMHSGKTVTFF